MPRYLVERAVSGVDELTAVDLKAIAQQILRVQQEIEAEIQWIYSIFIKDKMVCLYLADDEEIIREHARRSGLPIQHISKISAIITPTMDALN